MAHQRFYQELSRRHVFRVAIAYAVTAWLLLQLAAIVLPTFGAPHWVLKVLIAVFVLCFPLAIMLAWAFEVTPEGVRRTVPAEAEETRPAGHDRRVGRVLNVGIIVVLAAAVGVLAWQRFVTAPTPNAAHVTTMPASALAAASAAAASEAATVISPRSIAVLPFENLSTDKGNAYFADGMQDLILTKLADIGQLKVISRTSTMQYGSHPENLQQVGRQLGVATILEGSVQKAGNQVLINVQLIDAKTDSHIWAESYTRTLDNIFGVEGEVAGKIAKALNAKLTASESAAIAKIPTHNKHAYTAYLKARYFLDDSNRTEDASELQKSIALSKEAVAADPNFVEGWVLLALGYQKIGNHTQDSEKAALHALAIDPDSANAHVEYAFALVGRKDFEQAIAQAKEGVRLKPEGMRNNAGLGFVYQQTGHLDEAAAVFAHTVQLYPQVNFIRKALAGVEMMQRQYAAARETLRYVVDRDPADVVAAANLAQVDLLGWGNVDAARKVLRDVSIAVASSGALADAWYWLDMYARDYSGALAVIQQAPASWFQQQDYPLALYKAQAYRAQGSEKQARQFFMQARAMLEAAIRQAPQDAALRVNLALAMAGLGSEDADAQAQRAVQLESVWAGHQALLNLAVVRAWTGKTRSSLKILEDLLHKPTGDLISVNLLELAPAWDPIRQTSAFQGLLKKYARLNPAQSHPVNGP